jgi:hypothetical protein
MSILTIGGGGGSSSGSSSGSVSPQETGWLTPPIITNDTINGLTEACGMFCNVLNIGDRNYFSCAASGAYTVSVYTSVGGTLISRQNIAANTQCNWQIDWANCTHNIDANTRQAYVEATPQAGQALTFVMFNNNNTAETNPNSESYLVSLFYRLPSLASADSMLIYNGSLHSVTHGNYPAIVSAIGMHHSNSVLKSVTHGNYPSMTSAINMHIYNSALQSVTHGNYPVLTNATNMHHSNSALQSVTHGNYPLLTNATNMHIYNSALQSVTHGNYPVLIYATNMHHSNSALQSVTHGNYPSLYEATNMHLANFALQSVTHGNYPSLTNATNMHHSNYVLQSCYFGGLSALIESSGMFGTTTEATCCRSLRKLITNGLGTSFQNGTTFVLSYTAIQEPEALAWVSSLGSSANTITFDLRNNPFSTSALVAPAILAKFPNATVTL